MSTTVVRGPYEIFDAYLFHYNPNGMGEIEGIVIRRHDKDEPDGETLFIPKGMIFSAFLVSYFEGISFEGRVWYREEPSDGVRPGDRYTIRKAFADELACKIQSYKNKIEELKSDMKQIFPEGEELRVPDGPGFGD